MRHVFVETNWVVAYAAPAHLQVPAAANLLDEAQKGDLRLYLPAPCLTEARHPLRTKFQARPTADAIRKYLGRAAREGTLDLEAAAVVRRVLDKYESAVSLELEHLEDRLARITRHPGIEVFALSEAMLERTVQLSGDNLDLKPFDQAILAAILVRAEELKTLHEEMAFCELDSDLQPWDKNGSAKQPLTSLYDAAHLWVYGDFTMTSPKRPANFPRS